MRGNDYSSRNDLEQFRVVRTPGAGYDAYMSFSFLTSEFGACQAKLWATGRYGFSLPKKVEIMVPDGRTYTFLYFNRKAGLKVELSNQAIVRIAIAQFLSSGADEPCAPVELDDTVPPYDGPLAQVRAASRPVSLRVRPGASYARGSASVAHEGAARLAASSLD